MKKNLLLFIVLAFAFSSVNAQYWNLTGNAGTNTSSDFIGTTDPKPLIFKTSGFERMQLHPDQAFLGIGVPTPEATLHLHNPQNNGLIPLLQLTTNATGNAAANGFAVFSDYTTGDIKFKQQESAKFFLEGPCGGFVIAKDGNLGFGTEEPKQKMHLQGTLFIESTKNTQSGLQFKPYNPNPKDISPPPSSSNINYWDIYSDTQGLKFNAILSPNTNPPTPSQRLIITSNGSVGIGVANPKAKLAVAGTVQADNAEIAGTVTTNKLNVQILNIDQKLGIGNNAPLTNMQIGNIWTFQDAPDGKTIGKNTWHNGTNDVRIQSGDASRITFNNSGDILLQNAISGASGSTFRWNTVTFANNGNVGIGTTNAPSAKLEVNGDIMAKSAKISGIVCAHEVVVSLSGSPCWPDYVFEKDYNLLPLNEVEQFIAENKHLPDVPAAAQVKENGIELGEMNAILLKKIEELTLHLIQMEKRLSELESEKGGK